MKAGSRTLGVACSDGPDRGRLGGAVVRTDGTLDGLGFDDCTVGGTDATTAIVDLFDDLGRDDVQRVLCQGVAPAWFNVIDLPRLHDALARPVLAVSYEASPGLDAAIRREFDGDARDERLAVYGRLPERRRVTVGDRDCWVRAVGVADDRAVDLIRALTREGFRRPEPVRIASIAASAHREALAE